MTRAVANKQVRPATGGNRLPFAASTGEDFKVTRSTDLRPNPDRLFPTEPHVRAIARRLHAAVRDLPIISPHGHVDPTTLAANAPFSDPTSLLLRFDHYVTRLLHANGVALDELGVGHRDLSEQAARSAWRILCANWAVFRGTPVKDWLDVELSDIFGVTETPSAHNADSIYDHISGCLTTDEFRPRALFERFNISVLATTDDPCDDLAAHKALAGDASWNARVIPTFRPDRYLEPADSSWISATDRLAEASNIDTGAYAGYIDALESRRRYFVAHGATSADHSHADVRAEALEPGEAARIYRAARAGDVTATEATAFRRHMLLEMARMACDDGLVMALHPGVRRNHHSPTTARFGPDTGHDIPVSVEFTRALQPLLEKFGTHPGFQLVLFTIDETVLSREIAPLAGFYPSVYAGAPWWFLDAPASIRRYLAAVTETAGFTRLAGFVDDTRAFCSIPVRHDMSRRLEAGFLAGLVAEHRLDEDDALETALALVADNPRRAFKL